MNNKTITEFAYRMMGKNYVHLGGCYPHRPSAWMDNILLDLHNSSHPTQPHSITTKYTCSVILNSIGQKFTADRISVALETGSRSRPFLESLSYLCLLRKARFNYENI